MKIINSRKEYEASFRDFTPISRPVAAPSENSHSPDNSQIISSLWTNNSANRSSVNRQNQYGSATCWRAGFRTTGSLLCYP